MVCMPHSWTLIQNPRAIAAAVQPKVPLIGSLSSELHRTSTRSCTLCCAGNNPRQFHAWRVSGNINKPLNSHWLPLLWSWSSRIQTVKGTPKCKQDLRLIGFVFFYCTDLEWKYWGFRQVAIEVVSKQMFSVDRKTQPRQKNCNY